MASLWLPRTIEDDEEVAVEDSDSDEEPPSRNKAKKSAGERQTSIFSDDFSFPVESGVGGGGGDVGGWTVEEEVLGWAQKKRDLVATSLDSKILRAIELRRLKAEEKRDVHREGGGEGDEAESDEGVMEENTADRVSHQTVVADKEEPPHQEGSDVENETSSVDNDADEEGFFEEPPPPLSDVNFTDMNLSRPLLKAVHSIGYENPTPIQAATVPLALLGKDICACAATGTGKTAAFMLPILERLLFRPTHTQVSRVLVLVPTRELAIQVHSVGKALAKHTRVEFCLAAGGLDSRGQEVMLRKQPDIIIATPGRLVDHLHNAPSFNLNTIEILVLDEADRMLDEHFHDQMSEVIQHCPKSRQTMLFSATMTDKVEELAAVSLNHPVRLFVDRNTDTAENLHQEFVRVKAKREGDREAIVTALCSRTFKTQCLVFLQTKALAHRMRIIFGLLGLQAAELHGNRTQLQRIEALKSFKERKVDFLLATDLAARGLDIEGVKTVINYNMPTTVKQYIHRVGRTARAGHIGRSVSLVGEGERKMLKEVVKRAKVPAKSRVIPQDVVVRYRDRIRRLSPEVKAILKEEKEEKELRVTEMEMNKAHNMLEHEKEIYSRPPRTWLGGTSGSQLGKRPPPSLLPSADQPQSKKTKHSKKPAKEEDPKEKKLRLDREYRVREAKRQRRQKKLYKVGPEENRGRKKKGGAVKPRPVISGFEKELTDTSRQAVRGIRKTSTFKSKSKGKAFKSKRKYKRR